MDTYLVSSIVVISLVSVSYYKGYFSTVLDWLDIRRQRVKLVLSLIDKIQTDVKEKKDTTPTFTVNETDASASLVYERMGEKYILLVPYNRKHVAPMNQFKVELLRKGKSTVDITQQPGIPYLVTAEELGGYLIKITNEETGKYHEYGKNVSPMYGEETMEKE